MADLVHRLVRRPAPGLFIILAAVLCLAGPAVAHAGQAAPDCGDWQDCRQRTLDAIAQEQYEAAHDLAWRAVQKGPKSSPELLFLLARAQSLSGRADDALVMLQRIAASGVAGSAVTDEAFSRVRRRPGWPAVEAALTGAPPPAAPARTDAAAPAAAGDNAPAAAPAAAPAPAPAATAPEASPAAAAASPAPAASAPVVGVQQAARFMAPRFRPGGLAYDAVSGRFVFGDLYGRKLLIAQDGVDHAVDFVRAESAGFYQVTSLAIDVPRGDLWVVSAEGDGGAAAIHKVQLISGRPLRKYEVPADLQPVRLVDLAVSPAGAVVALDAMSGRVFRLQPRAEKMDALLQLKPEAPASIAMGRDEQVAYVAHAGGISRIDLAGRRAAALSAPKDVALDGFERIRWYRNGLIGVQKLADGTRQVVRLQLNGAGRAVASAKVLETGVPAGDGPVFATVANDQFSYLVGNAPPGASTSTDDRAEVIVYRIPLS